MISLISKYAQKLGDLFIVGENPSTASPSGLHAFNTAGRPGNESHMHLRSSSSTTSFQMCYILSVTSFLSSVMLLLMLFCHSPSLP
jgi:hypothetical protein